MVQNLAFQHAWNLRMQRGLQPSTCTPWSVSITSWTISDIGMSGGLGSHEGPLRC